MRERIATATVALVLTFSILSFSAVNGLAGRPFNSWLVVWTLKALIEVVASSYCAFYVLVALAYRPPRPQGLNHRDDDRARTVAVVYLCCDDFDEAALNRIALCSDGAGEIVVHDDSAVPRERERVERAVHRLSAKNPNVRLLRRMDRNGGKPAALNNVLANLSDGVEFLLVLDSDSYLMDHSTLTKALAYFHDARTAVLQFRTIGHRLPEHGQSYSILSASITFYDVFVSFMDQVGWAPFLGHNAMLRVRAVREVGGFTPGQLADDIDLSVRIRLAGYAVRYGRDIVAGELHPTSYESLRRRTRKWSYGCTQILLRWTRSVLHSSNISLAEKTVFFLTVSYYHLQCLLLFYLGIFYVVLPFEEPASGDLYRLLMSASLILFLTFLPSLTWFLRTGRFRDWLHWTGLWALTYGSQDFVMLRGITGCLLGKKLPWIPTNVRLPHGLITSYLSEVLFGISVLAVAYLLHRELLLLPTTILFAGKFLASPFLEGLFYEAGRFETGRQLQETAP